MYISEVHVHACYQKESHAHIFYHDVPQSCCFHRLSKCHALVGFQSTSCQKCPTISGHFGWLRGGHHSGYRSFVMGRVLGQRASEGHPFWCLPLRVG